MSISKLGFGTYRVTYKNPNHQKALLLAIEKGVTLIDTSSNYMGGEAEILIGNLITENLINPEILTIITKGGYIQGDLLDQVLKGELEIEELVPYGRDCYHSIHPNFLHQQIKSSKQRLQVESIDCYLLHNPEYYLMTNLKQMGQNIAQIKAEMQNRIQKAFIQLEQEVQNGTIKSYGISSNSFAKSPNDIQFLEYSQLIKYAEKAASSVNNAHHHFTTIQMPYNLLEKEGSGALAWAKEMRLTTLTNRPLNAFDATGMHRLASYEQPSDYLSTLDNTTQGLDNFSRSDLRGILDDLHGMRMNFKSMQEAQHTLYKKALPFIQQILKEIKEPEVQSAARELFNPFFPLYLKEVNYYLSLKTKSYLKEKHNLTTEIKLEDFALNTLLEEKHIDTVLMGMRESSYVEQATHCLNTKTLN
jgi:aryl-alcohol dehydrogenase-like predicted oxidoreductase